MRNCRGSRAEALAYGASLALWQQRLLEQADAFIVPSEFARERLRELGAPLDWERVHMLPPPVELPAKVAETKSGSYALVVSRLAPEKGVEVAIEACRMAGVPLVVAGDGPERASLEARAGHTGSSRPLMETPDVVWRTGTQGRGAGLEDLPAQAAPGLEELSAQAAKKSDAPPARAGHRDLRFVGHVDDGELDRLRRGAGLAIVPSRSAETFGIAAAEAMAAGVPVVASRIGALPELVEPEGLVDPGDATALAEAIGRRWRDVAAAERGRARVQELCAPAAVAAGLATVYGTD
jgi:glycosyltransferase involved in cell wall biosynthesis